ncbi:uncharacterized protein F4817DRAFT_276203 [Daldinia loculata]|uniref:uncharacterized protein n=1 Tax=Daldinia loculata TaxID=103429 RepID=UPI0020C2373C|nr:uncharacterized protein F4817DRAFT_276203 [Daldinia loculata]KAI1642878.1 hypothetical protein F4817DRAFT_276203 [Daldinia loculata]
MPRQRLRTFWKRRDQKAGPGEGSYGLFEFPARPGQPRLISLSPDAKFVDIIAVHGLGGGWRTTWSSNNSEDSAIWLRDRLPEVLARINVRPRIRAFGYDASFVFTSSTSDLESCAQDLLTRIHLARQTEEEKQAPIIFIAHSLGGLLVKLMTNIIKIFSAKQPVVYSLRFHFTVPMLPLGPCWVLA